MMYPLIALEDGTEIVCSQVFEKDGMDVIKVYVERPDEEMGFRHGTYWLPEREWRDIEALSTEELLKYEKIILEALEDAEDLKAAMEALEEYEASGRKSTPIEELWKELEQETRINDVTPEELWEFAYGMAQMGGVKPSDEVMELALREIRGEMTTEEMKEYLRRKYSVK